MKSLIFGLLCLSALVAAIPLNQTSSQPQPLPPPPAFTEIEQTVISGLLEKHRLRDIIRVLFKIEQNKYSKPQSHHHHQQQQRQGFTFDLFDPFPRVAQPIPDRTSSRRNQQAPSSPLSDPMMLNSPPISDDSVSPILPYEGPFHDEAPWRQSKRG
ncbi:hypothetical protein Aperf_G00000061549 [Anoplocephala perfoliata]